MSDYGPFQGDEGVIASAQRIRSRVDGSEEVIQCVRKSLGESAYHVLRTVSFCYERGVLFLRGQLPTYFHKQLAQEAVRRILGVTRIVNQIEVMSEAPRHAQPWQTPIANHNTLPIEETAK
jgi:osmotically-inducible protein OsmY